MSLPEKVKDSNQLTSLESKQDSKNLKNDQKIMTIKKKIQKIMNKKNKNLFRELWSLNKRFFGGHNGWENFYLLF